MISGPESMTITMMAVVKFIVAPLFLLAQSWSACGVQKVYMPDVRQRRSPTGVVSH